MNLILLLIVVSEVCLGICAWLSPGFLRRVASRLLTRADVIETAQAESKRRLQYWNGVLRVPEQTSGKELAPEAVSLRIA